MRPILFAAMLVLAAAKFAPALESSLPPQGITVEPLLKSGETADGEPLKYPGGDRPEVTSVVVTIAPGGRTALHQHPVPVFAYVLKGTLTVKEEGKEARIYKQGDAFMETVGHWHQGFNDSDKPMKVLAVYVGEQGQPTTINKK
jgi:quercetin dioxygenase-like cupin family protein